MGECIIMLRILSKMKKDVRQGRMPLSIEMERAKVSVEKTTLEIPSLS